MNSHIITKYIYNSAFIAISITLAWFGRVPIFPTLPFLKLDFSDIPIIFSALVLGPCFGLAALTTSSFLRMMFFSSSGFLGFLIRTSLIISVLILGVFYNKTSNKFHKIIICISSIALGTSFKLFVSCVLWNNFFSMPRQFLNTYIFSVALPYNFVKNLLNMICSLYLFKLYCKKSSKLFSAR